MHYHASKTDKIVDIKKEIESKVKETLGYTKFGTLEMYFQGEIMVDDRNVSAYMLSDGSKIDVICIPGRTIKIKITKFDNKSENFDVNELEKITDLKKQYKFRFAALKVYRNNRYETLSDELTLKQHGIEANAKLKFVSVVKIKFEGNTLYIDIDSTVGQVKELVEENFKIPRWKLKVSFKNQELNNDIQLHSKFGNIHDKEIMEDEIVVEEQLELINIKVILDNTRTDLYLPIDAKLSTLKSAMSYTKLELLFYYKGKRIDENKRLRDQTGSDGCEIQAKSKLKVVYNKNVVAYGKGCRSVFELKKQVHGTLSAELAIREMQLRIGSRILDDDYDLINGGENKIWIDLIKIDNQVSVCMNGESSQRFTIAETETVAKLKEYIYDDRYIPVDIQKLKLDSEELEDTMTIKEVTSMKDYKCILEYPRIKLKMNDETLETYHNSTAENIRKLYAKLCGEKEADLLLKRNGHYLAFNSILNYGDVIEVEKFPDKVKIKVNFMDSIDFIHLQKEELRKKIKDIHNYSNKEREEFKLQNKELQKQIEDIHNYSTKEREEFKMDIKDSATKLKANITLKNIEEKKLHETKIKCDELYSLLKKAMELRNISLEFSKMSTHLHQYIELLRKDTLNETCTVDVETFYKAVLEHVSRLWHWAERDLLVDRMVHLMLCELCNLPQTPKNKYIFDLDNWELLKDIYKAHSNLDDEVGHPVQLVVILILKRALRYKPKFIGIDDDFRRELADKLKSVLDRSPASNPEILGIPRKDLQECANFDPFKIY